MLEVSFRFRHGCALSKLSERHPTVVIGQWCNFAVEVVEIHTGDPSLGGQLEQELLSLKKEGFKALARAQNGNTTQMLVLKCGHKRRGTISALIEDTGCLYLPPIVYRGGWEHYRMVAMSDDGLRQAMAALRKKGDVELVSKKPLKGELLGRALMMPASDILEELTPKQASALLAAIEHGYYRVPRRTRTEDIARSRKVPRTTFEEHVRKAESKVLNAMAPYVAMYAAKGN
ncbi:MAG TPA: helix-turn-helix domain-containing protein [Candidatus Thermoplasmatota archaeon]|nr:helix-turn-helix domain-containing protein [Candidatus Thermoplasmatota archaeon]